MKWNYILILALIFVACKPNNSEESPTTESSELANKPIPKPLPPAKLPELGDMVTAVDNLRLREKPGSDGRELMRLPERSVVSPTGNTTDLKQKVSLRGMSYNEPWIEVAVDDKIKGWVFAGAIDFQPSTSQLASRLFEDRCKRFFDHNYEEMRLYRKKYNSAISAEDLKSSFLAGEKIHKAASESFDSKCRISELPQDIDLLWVQAAFPGYTISLLEEATEVGFLANINQFIEKAEKTANQDDEKAFSFLKEINGGYSLLLRFRDWYEQTTDYGGVSKLGSNLHSKYLDQAELLLEENNIFLEPFIREECNNIVRDIVYNTEGYQREEGAVLGEIQKIFSKNYKILTTEQKTLIENRIEQFSDLKANKIRVNEKFGVH